ncbi:MAG: peptide chain release factor N(5)-glutamine methyltransferase [Spirochaetales bacterium]|nr:peptide chain release factor N(5)-glutamine methyltransferase [Spirochaetales bacterium]
MTLKQFYTQTVSSIGTTDARVLIMHILDLDGTRFVLNMDREIPSEKLMLLEQAVRRRADGEPVAYITGERGFYQNTFKVSPATLIPRADTEILVEDAVSEISKRFSDRQEILILDLCCGTGCIGISVAKALADRFRKIELTLSDISEEALSVCRENAETIISDSNIAVNIISSNLFENIKEQSFTAILSNPPYIRKDVIPTLERQVRFEPVLALDGGADGLDFVRSISEDARNHLTEGGLIEMEIGYDQGPEALSIMQDRGYRQTAIIMDLENCDRVVKAIL